MRVRLSLAAPTMSEETKDIDTSPILRRMREEDLDEIMALSKQGNFSVSDEIVGWEEFWPEESLRNWITNSDDPLIVSEDKGSIIGFILAAVHHPTRKATLENIFVHRDYRNKGIGTQLFNRCEIELRKKGIIYICALVETDNTETSEFLLAKDFIRGHEFAWLEKDISGVDFHEETK